MIVKNCKSPNNSKENVNINNDIILMLYGQRSVFTNEESYSAANSNGRKVLYISKGLDAASLLVKY